MYFPVSDVETPLWLPPLVAFVISFFTSMGGVSGAFLLLPFQVSVLNYTTPSVSATNQVFNIMAIPSGVYRFIREKRMVWPLTFIVIAGSVPGVLVGAWIRITCLPDPRTFKFFVGAVLLYIGGRLLWDTIATAGKRGSTPDHDGPEPGSSFEVSGTRFSLRRVEFSFQGKGYSFSPGVVFIFCLVVGVVSGIYGIGGGSIVAPYFVTILKLPVYTVAGAALMGTFISSISGVITFHTLAAVYPDMNVAPDWLLGLLFGAGGCCGIYLGARCQKHIPARGIKRLLCGCILFVSVRYLAGFFY